GFGAVEEVENFENLGAASGGRHAAVELAGEGDDADAVEIAEADVSEGGGDAFGIVPLIGLFIGLADLHGAAGVDEEVDVEIFFFFEKAEEKFFGASVDFPVERAEIVAGGVG